MSKYESCCFLSEKVQLLENYLISKYITCQQLAQLLDLIKYYQMRKDLIIFIYKKLVDKHNFNLVLEKLDISYDKNDVIQKLHL